MREATVRRVDFGYFVRPASETGDGLPRVEPCLGYLVDHADGMLLFDTGMGSNPDVDAHYRPRRQPLDDALVAAGARRDQIGLVANCHLHFEVLPGVFLLPTAGHTAGHQSLVVRWRDGTVIVAGQSHDTATAYSADVLAWRAHRDGHSRPLPVPPAWVNRLQELNPARVVFAHDHSVWEP